VATIQTTGSVSANRRARKANIGREYIEGDYWSEEKGVLKTSSQDSLGDRER
jgi:hypothetical protein